MDLDTDMNSGMDTNYNTNTIVNANFYTDMNGSVTFRAVRIRVTKCRCFRVCSQDGLSVYLLGHQTVSNGQ